MDPNFPPQLDIHPLDLGQSNVDDQTQAIRQYGIAGRVWEASKPLIEYFTPGKQFDPPCPIFCDDSPRRIVELGSGQALASLHLAKHLSTQDSLVLTDLDNVVPLCQQSVDLAHLDSSCAPDIAVRALGWGGDSAEVKKLGPYDYIVLCDLIYFPSLYPPLLFTLLDLTEGDRGSEPTFGPTVILSYHSRTLALEESFFEAFGRYFQTVPVIGVEGAKVYLCRRWRVTTEWTLPSVDQVMNGSKEVIRGRDFGLEDELFGSMEY